MDGDEDGRSYPWRFDAPLPGYANSRTRPVRERVNEYAAAAAGGSRYPPGEGRLGVSLLPP